MIRYERMNKSHIGGMVKVEEECFRSGFAEKTFREKGTVDEKGLWTMWIMWRNPFCGILSSTKNVEKWRKTGKCRNFC